MNESNNVINIPALKTSLKELKIQDKEDLEEYVQTYNDMKSELERISSNHDSFLSNIDLNNTLNKIKTAITEYKHLITLISKVIND